MDATSSMTKTKMQKLNTEQDRNMGCKSLSDLPTAVLKHILCFLPTKDVFRTSILSRQWQHLWKSIPNIEFKQELSTRRDLFMNFVERYLVLRDSTDIKKFSLTCDVLHDAYRISTWVSAAVNHNVEELSINLSDMEEPFILPHQLFTCKTLTSLEICMPCILRVPSSVCLSSLNILTLNNVIFPDSCSTQQLFALPNLQYLEIDDCDWKNLMAICISAPKLHSLIIFEMDESNSTDLDSCQIIISGTSLTHFYCYGQFFNDYCLFYSSSLVDACIEVSGCDERPKQVAYRVYKLLRDFSNVKSLTLSPLAVQVLDYAAELLPFLPVFVNLTSLKFNPKVTLLDSSAFWRIVHNSPQLKSLEFHEVKLSSHRKEGDGTFDRVPPCFMSCLKSIEIHYFGGDEKELDAVHILLKNATALDNMVISCSETFVGSPSKIRRIHERLLELPRWYTIGKFIVT